VDDAAVHGRRRLCPRGVACEEKDEGERRSDGPSAESRCHGNSFSDTTQGSLFAPQRRKSRQRAQTLLTPRSEQQHVNCQELFSATNRERRSKPARITSCFAVSPL